jgi:excisionase family DNA binding protein
MHEYARFVSVARFAKLVGLSERMCWKLIRRRTLPVYRVGRRTLIKAEQGFEVIERLAEEHPSARES